MPLPIEKNKRGDGDTFFLLPPAVNRNKRVRNTTRRLTVIKKKQKKNTLLGSFVIKLFIGMSIAIFYLFIFLVCFSFSLLFLPNDFIFGREPRLRSLYTDDSKAGCVT